uniref:Uncharacterized protein n=1 Tax=Siphoviridae sp. ctj7g1 TaxID=2826438 RepID=A0A8S5R1D5_9CAUD|nr:MAG TPA: hypothetical protein [Siphoviridae sp. ctj7g1]
MAHLAQKHPLTRAFTSKHPGPLWSTLFWPLVKYRSSRAFS